MVWWVGGHKKKVLLLSGAVPTAAAAHLHGHVVGGVRGMQGRTNQEHDVNNNLGEYGNKVKLTTLKCAISNYILILTHFPRSSNIFRSRVLAATTPLSASV